jgi:predicted ATPase
MLKTLAVANYRSINKLVIPLGRLNLITGPNGSGKSNLYRALRLLAETAQGGVVNALAREGGLDSTFWAGPENISRRMRNGEVPIEATVRQGVKRLRLGFAGEDFSYSIALGLPAPTESYFALDPEIKKECIWAGALYRPASLLVDREGPMIRAREGRNWDVLAQHTPNFDSLFDQVGSFRTSPEVMHLREFIRRWRFYDHFRSDADAPVRQPQLGTRTPVLHHDGRDLAAALQTIREIGDPEALQAAISDAFPGALEHRTVAGWTLRHRVLSGRVVAAVVGGGVVGWHAALSAAGRRLADASTADADGAERAGNQPAPGPVAGVGAADHPCVRAMSGVGGVPCPALDLGVAGRPGVQLHCAGEDLGPDRDRRATGAG